METPMDCAYVIVAITSPGANAAVTPPIALTVPPNTLMSGAAGAGNPVGIAPTMGMSLYAGSPAPHEIMTAASRIENWSGNSRGSFRPRHSRLESATMTMTSSVMSAVRQELSPRLPKKLPRLTNTSLDLGTGSPSKSFSCTRRLRVRLFVCSCACAGVCVGGGGGERGHSAIRTWEQTVMTVAPVRNADMTGQDMSEVSSAPMPSAPRMI